MIDDYPCTYSICCSDCLYLDYCPYRDNDLIDEDADDDYIKRKIMDELTSEEIAERFTEASRANGISMAEAADKLEEFAKHLPPPSEEDIYYVTSNTSLSWRQKRMIIKRLRKAIK